jgi:hypothetical protein
MSETLNTPWIADYLINIAETYGSNLSSVPLHLKPGRKVQLIEASRELYGRPRSTVHSHLGLTLFCSSSSLSRNLLGMTASGPMSLTSTNRYLCVSLDTQSPNMTVLSSYCPYIACRDEPTQPIEASQIAKEKDSLNSGAPSRQSSPSSPSFNGHPPDPPGK